MKRRLAAAMVLVHGVALADDPVLQRVVVDGARASQFGVADTASAGSVSQVQLDARINYRPAELLEATPGLIVTQHSGEGKANQFYLRGFNLDHGTDLRTSVDDMPVNQRSHAHGQGWTDLNFLIPELAARLDYKKGPYSAREGDFASAGSASVTYANRLARPIADLAVGGGNYTRAMVAASPELGEGSLLYALELLHKDGPFVRPDNFSKINAVLRFSEGPANNGYTVSAMAYRGKWNATDQVPQRALDAGLGRFDTLDASNGGAAQRYSLSGTWRRTAANSATKLSAYLIRNTLDLYSNFTYFLDDPVDGDQFAQPDRRVTSGANVAHTWHQHDGGTFDVTVGAQVQNDNIFNGLHKTRARQTLTVTREDHIVEASLGVFGEVHSRWNERLRTVIGLRADHYRFDVAGSARTSASMASPSLGLAYTVTPSNEIYFSAGSGFHSNDARATVAAEPAPGLVRSRGLELGLRSTPLPGLQTAAALYRLDFDSELVWLGDAGATEAGAPSRRTGVELSNYYKLSKSLSVDLDLAYAHARTRGTGSAHYLANAVEGVGQLALNYDGGGPWTAGLRARYVGPRPLVDDNSVRGAASLSINARLGWRIRKGLRLDAEVFNLANRHASAAEYYYESRLKDESSGRGDLHLHPLEPRSLRLSLALQL